MNYAVAIKTNIIKGLLKPVLVIFKTLWRGGGD